MKKLLLPVLLLFAFSAHPQSIDKKKVYYLLSEQGASAPYIPIIVKLGQSNSLGFAERTRQEALTGYSTRPNGVKRFLQTTWGTAGGSWTDYTSGLSSGAGSIIGKMLYDYLKTPVYIMEAARGGSSLAATAGTYNDWVTTEATELFNNFETKIWDEGIAKIPNPNGLPLKVLFIEWHQGESDAGIPGDYPNYATNFATLTTALRAIDPLLAEAPLFVNVVNWAPSAGQTAVNLALSNFCAVPENNAYLIDSYNGVAYPWKQNLPVETRTSYPPVYSGDDNHASYLTILNKAELYYAKLEELGRIQSYSPTVFDYDFSTQEVIESCTRRSISLPTANNLSAINTLILSLKSAGVWAKLRLFFLPANDVSATFGNINIKSPDIYPPIFNSGVWTANQGFKSNGTSQFLYNIAPGASPYGASTWDPYWQNNIFMGEYCYNMTSKMAFGIRKAGSAGDFYFSGTAPTGAARAFGSTTATPAFTTSDKFFAINRIHTYPNASTQWEYYVEATKTTVTDTRTGTTTDNIQWLRDGVTYGDETVAVYFWGESMSEAEVLALRSAIITYMASL